MEKLAKKGTAQDQLLGLRPYYLSEYQKAANEIGDVDKTAPKVWESDYG